MKWNPFKKRAENRPETPQESLNRLTPRQTTNPRPVTSQKPSQAPLRGRSFRSYDRDDSYTPPVVADYWDYGVSYDTGQSGCTDSGSSSSSWGSSDSGCSSSSYDSGSSCGGSSE